jgi:hypothetical protein
VWYLVWLLRDSHKSKKGAEASVDVPAETAP